jgi:hypothetical protein
MPLTRRISAACVYFLIVCLLAERGMAQCSTPNPKGPEPFKQLRYDEDYRYLRDENVRTELLDRIKYIPLSGDGSTYLSIGGEIRERYEAFRNRDWGADPPDDNGYLLQRYMLHSDLHFGSRVRFFFQLKSGLASGELTVRPPDKDKLDVNQGFIDVTLFERSDRQLVVRVGRQEIQFGSSRIVSFREGPNVRQSFDGFRLSLCDEGWKVDLIATKPVETNVGFFDDAPDHARSFWGVYAVHSIPFLSGATADIYNLGLDRKRAAFDQGTAREIRHSIGARLSRPGGGLDYNFEVLYQWGAFGPGHISAWTVASDTGYTLKDIAWKPRLSLKANVASGDKDPNNPDLQSFNPLFPKGSYFGEEGLIGPVNFFDLHPTIDLHISKAITLVPSTLFFWRQSTEDGLYGPAVNLQRSGKSTRARYVATNPELELDWTVNRHLGATIYYSHSFAGSFLQATGPAKNMDFLAGWVTYKF